MTRIAHLSDLHFGKIRSETLKPLREALRRLAPDLVVVSGDLTQRATKDEFIDARDFLNGLVDAPQLIVPGNHDIPLYNLWRRFVQPRKRFDHHITAERYPSWSRHGVMVVGIDTARSWAISNGRINRAQLRALHDRFATAPESHLRIVVAHHPFVLPDELPTTDRVGRADMALSSLMESAVDLILTGHRHIPWVSPLSTSVPTVHAGTTTSTRTRGVGNSFNEIVVTRPAVTITSHEFSGAAFLPAERSSIYRRDEAGRLRTPEEPTTASTLLAASA